MHASNSNVDMRTTLQATLLTMLLSWRLLWSRRCQTIQMQVGACSAAGWELSKASAACLGCLGCVDLPLPQPPLSGVPPPACLPPAPGSRRAVQAAVSAAVSAEPFLKALAGGLVKHEKAKLKAYVSEGGGGRPGEGEEGRRGSRGGGIEGRCGGARERPGPTCVQV